MKSLAFTVTLLFAVALALADGPKSAAGRWLLSMGKATHAVSLADSNGVLRGTLTKDPGWGGAIFPIRGVRVGEKVELFYSETKRDTGGGDSMEADFTFKGTLEATGKMSGSVKVATRSFVRGKLITNEGDVLWTATHAESATPKTHP